jgi:hypothetical protein
MARYGPRKYDPLTRYLAALTVDEVVLTFPEIEQIVGAPLPRSAYQLSFWRKTTQPLIMRSWIRAGWRVVRAEVHARPPAVHFARMTPETTTAPPVPPRRSSPFTVRQRRQRGTPIVDG